MHARSCSRLLALALLASTTGAQSADWMDAYEDCTAYASQHANMNSALDSNTGGQRNSWNCWLSGGSVGALEASEVQTAGVGGSPCLQLEIVTTFDAGSGAATLSDIPTNFWPVGGLTQADLDQTTLLVDVFTDVSGVIDPGHVCYFELRDPGGVWADRVPFPSFTTTSGWQTLSFNIGQDHTGSTANFLANMNAGGHESVKMIFRTTGAYTAGKRFLFDNLRLVYSGNQAGTQWADDFDNLTADRYQTKDFAGTVTDSGNLPWQNLISHYLGGAGIGTSRLEESTSAGVAGSGAMRCGYDVAQDVGWVGWQYNRFEVAAWPQGALTQEILGKTTIEMDVLLTDASGGPAPGAVLALRVYSEGATGGWANRLDLFSNYTDPTGQFQHISIGLDSASNAAAFVAALNTDRENRGKLIFQPNGLSTWSGGDRVTIDNLRISYNESVPGLGTIYCEGSGGACPCGNDNDGSFEGAGCANGSSIGGCSVRASGTSSVSAGDLVLLAFGMVPSQPGLFFQGNNAINGGAGVHFGDGLRCAGGGVIRLQVVFAAGDGTGHTTIEVSAAGSCAAGDVKRYQLWGRDPSGSICGALFNLSNGLEITWDA